MRDESSNAERLFHSKSLETVVGRLLWMGSLLMAVPDVVGEIQLVSQTAHSVTMQYSATQPAASDRQCHHAPSPRAPSR